jgi:hypothetical protein
MDIAHLNDRIQRFFQSGAELTAKVTFFVRRRSKLTASRFVQGLVFGWLANPLASLNDLVAFMYRQWGIHVSPQGLDARIHRYAVDFMKKMCQNALLDLCHRVQVPIPLLTQFTEVNITDSTNISLPDCLATRWPGHGGTAPPAGLKLQVVFEFLTGTFKKLWITKGNVPDQGITRHVCGIQRGSLNLFDLGYFALARLNRIADQGAYFLCRLLPGTGVYTVSGERVQLWALLRHESRDRFELTVCIGKRLRIPCRLCCFRAPTEVAQRRRRTARQQAKKAGRTPSKERLGLLGWTLLVSNAPATRITLQQAGLLYTLRWQIELVFKLWKSQMQLDHIAGVRKERVQVELYAKLIGLLVVRLLAMPVRSEIANLSPAKAFKRVAEYSPCLVKALASTPALTALIQEIQDAIRSFATREKRKTRLTTVQQLLLQTKSSA